MLPRVKRTWIGDANRVATAAEEPCSDPPFRDTSVKLLAGFHSGEPSEWANFLPVLTSELSYERTVKWLVSRKLTWHAALDALKLTLVGRNLPGGKTLGMQLATLRRRRGISQAALARMAGVTKPTIGALEREGKGRLSTLEHVLTVLGAGAYLAPRDQKKAFFTTAGNSSVGQRWETPSELLSALYRVFRFDLDPCSPRKKGPVKARVRFTADDDGLSLPWHGTVFVNPPYGRAIAHWIAKARSEFEQGNAQRVVLLIPARTDTSYWHEHIQDRAKVWFLRGRLKFNDGKQSAPFPSALVIYGAGPEECDALGRGLRAEQGEATLEKPCSRLGRGS
jgi:phage N-6-adenine-methyltransferase